MNEISNSLLFGPDIVTTSLRPEPDHILRIEIRQTNNRKVSIHN